MRAPLRGTVELTYSVHATWRHDAGQQEAADDRARGLPRDATRRQKKDQVMIAVAVSDVSRCESSASLDDGANPRRRWAAARSGGRPGICTVHAEGASRL